MWSGKPSNRCVLHRVLSSSSSHYLVLPPFMRRSRKPGRQHNDGKWSAKCQGPERDRPGLRRSMACCLPSTAALSGLQDEQRTKQPETAAPAQRFGAQTCTASAQGQNDDYKKKTVNKVTIIVRLSKYYSVVGEGGSNLLLQSVALTQKIQRWHLL